MPVYIGLVCFSGVQALKALVLPAHGWLIIWRGLVWARHQILQRQSCLALWICTFVRACTENLMNRFYCNFFDCYVLWSSCAMFIFKKNHGPLHSFLGRCQKFPLTVMMNISLQPSASWASLCCHHFLTQQSAVISSPSFGCQTRTIHWPAKILWTSIRLYNGLSAWPYM